MTIQLGRVGTHRYLEETSAELVSEGLALLLGYHSLLHVALVADHNHGHLSFDVKGEKDLMLNDARMTTSAENSHLSVGVNAEDLFADSARLVGRCVQMRTRRTFRQATNSATHRTRRASTSCVPR